MSEKYEVTPPLATRNNNQLTDTPEAYALRQRRAIQKLKALRSQYADLGQPISVEVVSENERKDFFQDEIDTRLNEIWASIDDIDRPADGSEV